MKVIYVPLTIPYNWRSIIALTMTVICGITITLAAFSYDWWHVDFGRSVVPGDTTDTLDSVKIHMGPWRMKAELCGYHKSIGKRLCHDRSFLFQECRKNTKTNPTLLIQTISFQGSLEFNWCSAWKYMMAAFFMCGIAAILGLFSFFTTFFRETCHGPWTVVQFVCTVIALIAFAYGVNDMNFHEIDKLQNRLAAGQHTVTKDMGNSVAFVFVALACVAYGVGMFLTLSLCCCPPKDWQGPPEPKIQVVAVSSEEGGPIPSYPPGHPMNNATGGAAGGPMPAPGQHVGHSDIGGVDYGGGGNDDQNYDRLGGGGGRGDQEMSPRYGNHAA